jgi:hypothetical protein
VNQSGPLAALDPGRSKCGLVRTDGRRLQVEEALILPPEQCRDTLAAWHGQGLLVAVVLGDGTTSRSWCRTLAGLQIPTQLVDERGTTLAARERYWQLWPARGWRRLLPRGLRVPPRQLDDLAAQAVLERWLQRPLTRSDAPRSEPAP